jgi:hypothetical protein
VDPVPDPQLFFIFLVAQEVEPGPPDDVSNYKLVERDLHGEAVETFPFVVMFTSVCHVALLAGGIVPSRHISVSRDNNMHCSIVNYLRS